MNGTPATVAMMDYVSRHISREWKNLGRHLLIGKGGLSDAESVLDNINHDYRQIQEKCYQMLICWKESNSASATAEVLVQALRSIQNNLVANCLESMIPKQQVLRESYAANYQESHPHQYQQRVLPGHVNLVSEMIGAGWWDLGIALGLPYEHLSDYHAELRRTGTIRVCVKMLNYWTRNYEGTLHQLVSALTESKNESVAKKLEKMLKDTHLS